MANQQTQYSANAPETTYQAPYGNPTPAAGAPNSKNLFIIAIISLSLAIIGILIGILNLIQISQTNGNLGSLQSSLGLTENEPDPLANSLTCTLPSSPNGIQYLNITYRNGDEEYYITPTSIEPYIYGASDEEVISTDTSDIAQYIFSNGLKDFSDYEYGSNNDNNDNDTYGFTNNWAWSAEIISADGSSCLAKGNDTAPDWFTSVISMINNKIKQPSN